jgi:hypothetical protein
MTTFAMVAAVAVLVTGAVLFVVWPFTSAEPEPDEVLSDADRRRLELRERRDEAYQGLRDLEEDMHAGKITPADYELERGRLRAEAAAALRELDELTASVNRLP